MSPSEIPLEVLKRPDQHLKILKQFSECRDEIQFKILKASMKFFDWKDDDVKAEYRYAIYQGLMKIDDVDIWNYVTKVIRSVSRCTNVWPIEEQLLQSLNKYLLNPIDKKKLEESGRSLETACDNIPRLYKKKIVPQTFILNFLSEMATPSSDDDHNLDRLGPMFEMIRMLPNTFFIDGKMRRKNWMEWINNFLERFQIYFYNEVGKCKESKTFMTRKYFKYIYKAIVSIFQEMLKTDDSTHQQFINLSHIKAASFGGISNFEIEFLKNEIEEENRRIERKKIRITKEERNVEMIQRWTNLANRRLTEQMEGSIRMTNLKIQKMVRQKEKIVENIAKYREQIELLEKMKKMVFDKYSKRIHFLIGSDQNNNTKKDDDEDDDDDDEVLSEEM